MRLATLLPCLLACAGLQAADPAPRTIDASQFPNLQAAFDAVPAAGGVVQLPPGTFEIDQPLRLKTGDTWVVGAGAATHIVNRNEAGQPALVYALKDALDASERFENTRLSGPTRDARLRYRFEIEARFKEGAP